LYGRASSLWAEVYVEKRSVSASGSPQMKRLRQPVKCDLFVGWGRQTDCSLQISVMQAWVSDTQHSGHRM